MGALDEMREKMLQEQIIAGGITDKNVLSAIIITAAPPEIPEGLIDQLKTGGRMIVPVGSFRQELGLIERTPNGINKKTLLPVRFVPMVHSKQDGEEPNPPLTLNV